MRWRWRWRWRLGWCSYERVGALGCGQTAAAFQCCRAQIGAYEPGAEHVQLGAFASARRR
jgi:hypothetical protein